MTSQGCREVSKYILLGLTILAWIFAVASVASCSFVQVGGASYGLFKGDLYSAGTCVRYPSGSDFVGAALPTARAFGVLLTLGLSAAMVLVIVVVLLYPHPAMWITYRVLLGLCFVFNLMTFVAFAECADLDAIQTYEFLTCNVGGASVCAILNSWLLLPISVLSCCIPAPEEPVFKHLFRRNNNNDMMAGSQIVKRTVEETPDGTKITEQVTDASGATTVTTSFEPNDASSTLVLDGFDVGPTVRTMVSDLPNGKKIVEEDAQGNQTITTKVILMASDNWTRSTTQYGTDRDIVVANVTPQYQDSSSNAVMAAAAVIPSVDGSNVPTSRELDNDQDEEQGRMANPYIDHAIQEHVNRQVNNSQYEQPSSPRTSRSSQSSRPKSSKQHGRSSRGQAENHDEGGTAKPVSPRSRDTSGYLEDSVSSALTNSHATFDTSMNSSASSLDNSFTESSNFDNSFNDSTALDGAEPRPKKKKKKKKHHKSHRSSDGEHRSKKRKEEGSDSIAKGVEQEQQQQAVGASTIGPYE